MSATYNLAIIISQVSKGNAIRQTTAELMGMQTGSQKLGATLTNMLAPALLAAGLAAVKFAVDSYQAFMDFDKGTREIFTLIPNATQKMTDDMREDILAASVDMARLPDEVIPAVYQAISLGIPAENVMHEIEVASNAARAGAADLTTTLTIGQQVVNAYGGELYNLTDVYDIMFTMIRDGAITMDDLQGNLSKVTAVAGETGTRFEDIGAALVTMTKQGDDMGEATQLLSILLMQLGTDGTAAADAFRESWGGSYRDFIAQGGTLVEALELMEDHAMETGQSLGEMIGGDSPFFRDTQAARAAMELTGFRLEMLREETIKMEEAAGNMAAAAKIMGDAHEVNVKRMQAAWSEFKIVAGEAVAPFFERLVEGATAFLRLGSGNYERGAARIVEANKEMTRTTEELIEHLEELSDIRGKAEILGTGDEVQEDIENTIELLAIQSDSVIEFKESLERLMKTSPAVFTTLSDNFGVWEENAVIIYRNAKAMHESANEAELWQRQLEQLGFQGYVPAGAAAEEYTRLVEELEQKQSLLTGATAEYQNYLEYLAQVGRAYNEVLEETNRATRDVTERYIEATPVMKKLTDTADEQIEIVDELAQAINELQSSVASYFGEALKASDTTFDFNQALLEAAIAAGVNLDTLIELAEATGNYDTDAIKAAAAQAELLAAMDLAVGVAANYKLSLADVNILLGLFEDGLITSQEQADRWARQLEAPNTAVQTLLDKLLGLESESPYDFVVEADTEAAEGDLITIQDYLRGLHDKTVTVTTHYETSGTPPPTGGGYQGPPEEGGGGNFSVGGVIVGPQGHDNIRVNTTRGEGILPVRSMRRLGASAFEMIRQGRVTEAGRLLANQETGSGSLPTNQGQAAGESPTGKVYVDRSQAFFIVGSRDQAESAAAVLSEKRRSALQEFLTGV